MLDKDDTPQKDEETEKVGEEKVDVDKKDGQKGEDKPDWVKIVMERNAAKAKRMELERKMANDGVKRSYRLKSK